MAISDVRVYDGSVWTSIVGINGADGNDGIDGLSAYEVAVANGFVGDQPAWLDSLEGDQGIQGIQGDPGSNGANGSDGADGLGWTGGSYSSGTGVVTFTSDDGLGFSTGDLRGADGAPGPANLVIGSTAPATDKLWLHTTDLILYAYDSTRSKWLSTHEYVARASSGSGASTSNIFLGQPGGLLAYPANNWGIPVQFDVTVTGWTWQVTGTTTGREVALNYKASGGSNVARHANATPAGTWSVYSDDTLDADMDAESQFGFLLYAGGGNSAEKPRVELTYRRRPSSGV